MHLPFFKDLFALSSLRVGWFEIDISNALLNLAIDGKALGGFIIVDFIYC